MYDITPEPATIADVIADPSDPRWTPPEGNRIDVGAPDAAEVEPTQ